MKYKFLLLTSLLVLIFSSCKNIEQNTSLSETTTVTFAADNTRSIYSKLSDSKYTYTIRGKAKSGATFQTDRHYTYNELSYTRFEIQKGTWDFTMNAFTGEEVIFTETKSVTIDKSSVINIPLYAKTGFTASLSVKLNYPENKGVAKITGALYDSVTEADAGSALTLEAGYVTYTNDDVPSGINKILKFYIYDSQNVCIASYIEGVYLAAQDNVSVERTLSNVNMFAATVSLKDANGNDLTDSGVIIKAVKDNKEYAMTAVSGTNMYTASLPVGTYDVYNGTKDTGADLVVEFPQGGTTSFIYYGLGYTATRENFSSVVTSLTEYSTIVLTGELTDSDLQTLKIAINNSPYKVNLDLSRTTGLTSIMGIFGLAGCSKLSGITIPDSVTSIGYSAFYGCTSLSSVTIPDSVTRINDYAFNGCTSLSSVTIPDSVTSIDGYAFDGCTSLSSVTIPDSVISIGDYAFQGCTALSSVTIGNSVTSIGEYTFYGCTSLSSVTIGESVKSINYNAFEGCTSLSSVTIGDSVTSIGYSAFYGCTSLSSVTIPDSVTSIGNIAFAGCSSLTSVTIPNSVTSIGKSAFDRCTALSSVTIGNSVTSIGDGAFYGCTSLTTITVDSNNANYSSIDGVLFNKDATAIITYPTGKQSAAYTIPDSVTSIGNSAFADCTSLSSVTIPDYVTSIGNSAFENCSSLFSVTIPDSVTSIGNYAFRNCTSLSSVTIGDYVTSIGNSAFENCSSLFSVTIGDSVTSIGDYAFRNCTSLSSVTIPDSVTSIGDRAFNGCTALSSVTIGDSVTSIGTSAFEGCISLSSISIGDSVTSIGTSAFSGCTSLSSVTIPDSVTSIGDRAFNGCSKLTSLTFTDPTTWYRTGIEIYMINKTDGTETNVSDPATNATYFKDTYEDYYWYKLDE